MRVLVACEFSDTVGSAFRRKGHDVVTCDIIPAETDDPTSVHHVGDVRELLSESWDLMIAHPPCTYLTLSGVTWLKTDPNRWALMEEGAIFFRDLLTANIPQIAVENPIMHRYAREIIGKKQDQIVQPFMFGHLARKSTALWLKNLPKIVPTNNRELELLALPHHQQNPLHHLGPSANRQKLRSKTYPGLAAAMAEQWGS